MSRCSVPPTGTLCRARALQPFVDTHRVILKWMDVRNQLAQSQTQQAYEERQFQKYVSEQKNAQQRKLEELEAEHSKQIQEVTKRHDHDMDELEKAYKVELSRTKEVQDRELAKVRESGQKHIEKEKAIYEETAEKMAAREKSKVDHVRKTGESVIQSLHEKYQRAQEQMKRD